MRAVCISDTHLAVTDPASLSLFPRYRASRSEGEVAAIYAHIRAAVHWVCHEVLSWVEQSGPWDLFLHLGDVLEGYGERGCLGSECRVLAQQLVKNVGPLARCVHFCAGDHDTGYWSPVSLPGSGLTVEGLESCEGIFGGLWWADVQSGLLFLGVCSPLVGYRGRECRILRRQRAQAEFIGDMLATHAGGWVLCTHEPRAPLGLFREIGHHTSRLVAMLCGRLHDPWQGTVLRTLGRLACSFPFGGKRIRVLAQCLKRAVICPSVAPLWCRGGGVLLLDTESTALAARPRAVVRPQRWVVPTDSFWWCVRWMGCPRGVRCVPPAPS